MLTLVLPVRDWPLERTAASVRSFLALASDALTEVLIIDFGSSDPIPAGVSDDPRVKVVRLEADVWSLAEAINAGVLLASNDLIAKTDADILVTKNSRVEFDRMVSQLQAGQFGLGLCQATDLHQSLSVAEAEHLAATSGEVPTARLRPKWGQGGLAFFSRTTWDAIGGFDSRFTGWGNEDNDFAERIRRSGQRIVWAEREQLKILHVWHPPSYAATGVITQRARNQKIVKEDKSVLRPVAFLHSNFGELTAPNLRKASPLVTLGIATTARPNRDRMIREAINSFRGQINNDFEVLIVDNGSSADDIDELKNVLGTIRWPERMRLEIVETASIPGARNVISSMAAGRYICVTDDDDLALANRLPDHLKVMESDGLLHGSHGGWIDFDQSTGIIERNGGKQRTAATLLRGSGKITAHPASFYRTDVMRAVPYDEAFALGSDLDLALRMSVLGFNIGHTNSFVTLRRYHSSNVTITGQSNQVSNGASARARALASYAWPKLAGLEEAAKAGNSDIYCRNQLSIDSLAALVPGYTGQWQIYVPITAFTAAIPLVMEPEIEPVSGLSAWRDQEARQLPVPMPSEGPVSGAFDNLLLESMMNITPGDICTRHSGLNQPVYFRSVPITGLRKARRVKQAIEDLIKLPARINSVRQGELDRDVVFNWSALEVRAGERILKSEEFEELADLLGVLAQVDSASLMGQTLAILADYNDKGQVYSLVTPAIKGYDEVQSFKFSLQRKTGVTFQQVAANGIASELTLSMRSH